MDPEEADYYHSHQAMDLNNDLFEEDKLKILISFAVTWSHLISCECNKNAQTRRKKNYMWKVKADDKYPGACFQVPQSYERDTSQLNDPI